MNPQRKSPVACGRVGELLILAEEPARGVRRMVRVQCACGREAVLGYQDVIHGHTKSCGCMAHTVTPDAQVDAGLARLENGRRRPLTLGEIARETGMTNETVRRTVERALKKIRNELYRRPRLRDELKAFFR